MEDFEEFVERFGSNWRDAFAERLRAEGKRDTLANLLRLKFSLDPLPEWLASRVEAADLDALVAAARRILFADRPEDVLPETRVTDGDALTAAEDRIVGAERPEDVLPKPDVTPG